MKDKLIVESAVRKKIHSMGSKISKSGLAALEKKVNKLLEESVNRSSTNSRHTVLSRDI